MPHVDDGILHAHLDGALDALSEAGELPAGMTAADVLAHLTSCPDCSSRLRIEREMRERAGRVLADAGPVHFEIPPFPVVPSAAPARRRRSWVPMSWAASMLMALGAGWWGSEIWRSTMANESVTVDQAARPSSTMSAEDAGTSPESTGPVESAAPAAGDMFDVAPPRAPAAGGTEQTSASEAAVSNRQAPPSDGIGAARLTPDADATAARAAPQGVVAGAASRAAANASNAPAANASNAVVAAPPPSSTGDRPAPAKQTTPAVAQTTRSSDVQAASPPVTSRRESPPNAGAQLTAPSEARTVRSGIAEPQMRGAMNDPAESADMTLVAHAADKAAFHRLLENIEGVRFVHANNSDRTARTVLVIAAASDPVIETAAVEEQVVVRVRQTLETGEAVEVLSWQPRAITIEDIDLSAVAASSPVERTQLMAETRRRDAPLPQREMDAASSTLSDGRRQLVVRTATGQWIALRADLPATEMRVLMTRMQPSSRTQPSSRQ